METKKIIVATGQSAINDVINRFEGYEVIKSVDYRESLYEECMNLSPDILLIGEGLFGDEPLTPLLLNISKERPNTRIIYLAGSIDMKNSNKVYSLSLLVMGGIYDIINEKQITASFLKSILDKPQTQEQVDYIVKNANRAMRKEENTEVEFIIPEDENEENKSDVRNNLFLISSIKPGSGKSFVSVNLATAIAKYGVKNKEGKSPRVALIEADLQNLSLGTLLQIEGDDKNLKTAMNKIGEIVSREGELIGDSAQIEETNRYIKECFSPYYRVKNLEALVGSQLSYKELSGISRYHYIYLIDAISDYFDIIIVDTNSAVDHETTFPLTRMAKECYYILNLDFNNIRNNVRYRDVLEDMGITDKLKYILNEDVEREDSEIETGNDLEPLLFTSKHLEDSGFKLEARIPVIPKTVFLNRLYEGTPLVIDEKRDKATDRAKLEILKAANQIYPIENMSRLEEDYGSALNKSKKRGLFK